MGLIYIATNIINNKQYIGQTKNTLAYRKTTHLNHKHKSKTVLFHNAIKKYGKENFKWDILWQGEESLLNEMEIFFIKDKNTLMPNGYNMTIGGNVSPLYRSRNV